MKKKLPLILIFTVVFVDLLGFGILIPMLPTFAIKEIGLSETAIGLVIASYSLVQFIFNPIFGSLSDQYGRRKIILITLLLNAAGYLIFAYSHSFIMLLISRLVSGLGGSSIAAAQAYIADITEKKDRSKGMGLVGMAFGLGFVFGPILGGFLAEINYLFAGYAAAGFSFSAFLVSLFFLPESNPVTKASNNIAFAKPKIFNIEAMKKLAGISPQTVMIGMFFVLTFSVANIYGTFALLGTEIYRFTELKVGLTYGIMGITSATMQGGGIRILSKYINDRKLIIVGTFALMAALGLMPFGVNFLGTAIVCVILSIGTGILQPTILSLVSKVTDDSEQGVVLGVNQSLSSLARMLGPLWGGFAFQYIGYEFPFLTGAFFTFFILLFAIFYFNRYIKEEQPDPEKQC